MKSMVKMFVGNLFLVSYDENLKKSTQMLIALHTPYTWLADRLILYHVYNNF